MIPGRDGYRRPWLAPFALAALAVALPAAGDELASSWGARGARTRAQLKSALCRAAALPSSGRAAAGPIGDAVAQACAAPEGAESPEATARVEGGAQSLAADATLLARERIASADGIAIDLLSYASDGLSVGGVLCYPDDGWPHATVVHVHGGFGGIFEGASGDLLRTCVEWARDHGRTAFLPSLRGQDGGEGRLEVCGGEARDVAAGVSLLSTLGATQPDRVALVGGSVGGCVVLKASGLIPSLRAVVAFVPPTSWKDLVAYHRERFVPGVETTCDGETREWTIGGPAFADTLDTLICGRIGCSDADYDARSPLSALLVQSAPTLVVSAGDDNVVPMEQEILWSLLRHSRGHPVDVYVLDPCDPPGLPAPADDVLIHLSHGRHLLSAGSISSGLLFLMARLDEP